MGLAGGVRFWVSLRILGVCYDRLVGDALVSD